MTSHHGYVAVHWRDAARMAGFLSEMAANRYLAAGEGAASEDEAAG